MRRHLRDPDGGSRCGAILIIVIGLASVLLAIAVAFMVRMQADARAMNTAIGHAQARVMLTAALMYLQETSRIGWGDSTGECFGWTDVRDGGLGPRGPRPPGASGDPNSIPAPTWWTKHSWPAYKPFPNETTDFPPLNQRAGGWPLPGTAVRCPMAVAVQPPYAVQLTYNYNPVNPPFAYGSPTWNNGFAPGITDNSWPTAWLTTIFSPASGAKGMLDPQPVANNWNDFAQGQVVAGGNTADWGVETVDGNGLQKENVLSAMVVKSGTENRSWFRVYRELQGDHDDIDKPTNHLWWNRTAMSDPTDPNPADQNWSVFIVTCGSGGTRGYRFWDNSEITSWENSHSFPSGTGRCLEPVTASESGLFVSQSEFEALLLQSQILWYRCEWSALQSGARTTAIYNDPIFRSAITVGANPILGGWYVTPQALYDVQYADTWVVAAGYGGNLSDTRSMSTKTVGGNFKWMQRLDHDPLKW